MEGSEQAQVNLSPTLIAAALGSDHFKYVKANEGLISQSKSMNLHLGLRRDVAIAIML